MTFFLLILCIIQLESSDNAKAVGDNGLAVGPMQIQPILVADVNRIVGQQRYSLDDRRSYVKSAEMAFIYLSHYGSERRLGRKPFARDLLLIWNGGPNFYKHPNSTDAQAYLRKADNFLNRYNKNTLSRVGSIKLSNSDWLTLQTKDQ